MVLMLFFILLIFFMVFFIMNYMLMLKLDTKMSVCFFESGFDGLLLDQNSISVHFFLIMILFVTFDLELVLFMGFLLIDISSYFYFIIFFFFIMITFYIEFLFNKLLWLF